jgi:Flp pilus assembly protein TadG
MRSQKPSGRPRLAADRAGNIIIEFALALPIFTVMTLGLVDLGRYSMQKSALLQGARSGAQYGILDYSTGAQAKVESTAQDASGLTGVTATASWFCECVSGTLNAACTPCSGGTTLKRYVKVRMDKTFTSVLTTAKLDFGKFGSWTPPTALSAEVTMIVVVP